MTTKNSKRKKTADATNTTKDFRSFLSLLEEKGELVRVNKSVSCEFELAAVVSNLEGKQAILFEKIDKSQFKVASNDLSELPIVSHFEKDAGPYITSSIVFAKDPESDTQNSSTHRLLKLDDKNMVIRMVEGRHLHKCYSSAIEHGDDLKVAISIGVHPAISIAAAYQAAYGIDEMLIANSLLDGGLTVNKNHYSQLYIPAHCEIVLEGRILK